MSWNKLLPLLVVTITVALTGCVNDDRSDCYFDDNCVLLFEYSNVADVQFSRIINSVDAFVFDENGYYVASKRSEQSDLAVFRGVRMTLDPGRYYVVAWANVGTSTAYNGASDSFSGALVEIPDTETESGAQIYYAPFNPSSRSIISTRSADMDIYEVVVPYAQSVTKKLDFVRAHRSIYLWCEGYKDFVGGVNLCPTSEATNLWTSYNFFLQIQSNRRDFRQQGSVTEREGKNFSLSSFHFAYGELTDDMNVNVFRTSDNRLVETINVKDFVTANPATGTDDIHIMVTFTGDDEMDLGVSISLPSWIEKDLTPGVD